MIYPWKADFSWFGWAGSHGQAAPAPPAPAYDWQWICTGIAQVWPLRQCNMKGQEKICGKYIQVEIIVVHLKNTHSGQAKKKLLNLGRPRSTKN